MKKLIYSSLVMIVLGVSFVFASGVNQAEIDRVTGPGVGLKESDYTERIYAYGSLITGITGNEVVDFDVLDVIDAEKVKEMKTHEIGDYVREVMLSNLTSN